MTQEQYQSQYEAIEGAVESGIMTWKQGMAKASLLAFEFAAARAKRAEEKETHARMTKAYWSER